jgi:arginine decarboxylase
MLASLDVGRMQAELEGFKMLACVLEYAQELREDINGTGVFRVLELSDLLPEEVLEDGILLDPTKITVDISQSGYTVEELQEALFERYSIQVEKSTFNTITLLLTIGTTRSKCSRLYDALARIAREKRPPKRAISSPEIPKFTSLQFLPRDAFYVEGELVPLLDENDQVNTNLQHRVCADQIVPYPPGIPVLVPGQVITLEIAHYLSRMLRLQKRIELHGVVFDGYVPCLRVVKPEEAAKLKAL